MKKENYDWIVMNYGVIPNVLECQRCGHKQVMPEGNLRFSILEAIGNAFMKMHKDCIA